MKLMYQSIFACIFLFAIASMSGYKYTFHNKTNTDLRIEYAYKANKKLADDIHNIWLSPGQARTIDTGSWCLSGKMTIIDTKNQYKTFEDWASFRCYNKEWDIVVKKKKQHVYLDLVDHSEKNEDPVYIGKPSHTINIGK